MAKFWLNYFDHFYFTIYAIAYVKSTAYVIGMAFSFLDTANVPDIAFSAMDTAYVKCFANVPGCAFSFMDFVYHDVPACALFARLMASL